MKVYLTQENRQVIKGCIESQLEWFGAFAFLSCSTRQFKTENKRIWNVIKFTCLTAFRVEFAGIFFVRIYIINMLLLSLRRDGINSPNYHRSYKILLLVLLLLHDCIVCWTCELWRRRRRTILYLRSICSEHLQATEHEQTEREKENVCIIWWLCYKSVVAMGAEADLYLLFNGIYEKMYFFCSELNSNAVRN